MEIGGISADQLVVDREEAGFSGLTADDFMQMLIVQLQNQDPTEPMTNEELLTQISQIQSLQSNVELADAIKGTTSTQLLSNAANFIGKSVTAAVGASEVTGVVERARVVDGDVFVTVDGTDVPLTDVTGVNSTT